MAEAMAPAETEISARNMGLPSGAALLDPEDSSVSFGWTRVADHLASQGVALDLDFAPRRFAGGLANINMLVKVDGRFAVFRRPPDGPLPKGAHDMAREHRVLSGLAPVLTLAPRSVHYCGDAEVAGAPFQILEFRNGRTVRGDDLTPLPDTPESGARLSRLLVETLAQIHAVDPASAGLADLGRPEGFLSRTAAGWIARANAVCGGQLSTAANELGAWLQRQPVQDAPSPVLLHNDFKLDNLVLRSDALVADAVLDWDMATRGDPLFDLATLLSYWAEPGDPPCMAALRQMPTARPGFLSREATAEAYAAQTGRSLDGFIVPRVLAMFKLGVVFHQLNALPNEALKARLSDLNPDEIFVFALDVANGKVF